MSLGPGPQSGGRRARDDAGQGATRRGDGRARLLAALVSAFGLATSVLLGAPAVAPSSVPAVVAASSDTFVTGDTTYVVDPAAGAVHVSIAMTFKDTKADSTTVRYYYTGYRLGIQKEATGVTVTSGGTTLKSSVKPATDATSGAAYQILDITFAKRVYHDQSVSFTISYDLLDGGPRSTGLVRVGEAIAAFYAWSYGADRASVTIQLPAGFVASTQGSALTTKRNSDSSTTLAASNISDRASWFAWITAQRPSALKTVDLHVSIDGRSEPIQVQAFPDDQVWLDAVEARLTSGLPTLGRLIGLPWPVSGTLVVSEAYAPLLGGYAGLYRQAEQPGQSDTINITEDPDPLVIVHEASHAWFNGDLFTGRWINEGLADEYASRALAELGQSGYDPEQVSPTDSVAFPLESWPAPGRIDDPKTMAAERYGYNASWTVIRSLVTEIGVSRMQAVFEAARARTIPYVGRPTAESFSRNGAAPDWHVFLDLLEQVGGSHAAEGLFRTWIVGQADQADLTAHSQAIGEYAALVQQGAGWLPGLVVRQPMAAWDFPAAEAAMQAASDVLARRDQVVTLARSLGLKPDDALRAAYESATSSLSEAQALADQELATLEDIAKARTTVNAQRDILTTVGMIGAEPGQQLAAADADFEAGHLADARKAAANALRLLGEAPAVGRQRLLQAAAGLVVLLLLAGIAAIVLQRRRGRRRAAPSGAATLARDPSTRSSGDAGEQWHGPGPGGIGSGPPGP